MSIAYVSSPLDRLHDLRTQPDRIESLRRGQGARLLRVRGDMVETRGGLPLFLRPSGSADEIFLGRDGEGHAWFAAPAAADAEATALRSLMLEGNLSAETLSILAQARSLVHWHERHGFCAHCGAATVMQDSGYRRLCGSCNAEHFPRTDPVVIITVRHGENVLLGRQASWAPGMYSALAGFVEPGETIEQAARREVWEEAGVRVGAIRYMASQPWPFPSSLMIGLIGETDSATIKVDTSEIEDARWFTPDELRLMLEKSHPQGFFASHPYAIAHLLIQQSLAEAIKLQDQ